MKLDRRLLHGYALSSLITRRSSLQSFLDAEGLLLTKLLLLRIQMQSDKPYWQKRTLLTKDRHRRDETSLIWQLRPLHGRDAHWLFSVVLMASPAGSAVSVNWLRSPLWVWCRLRSTSLSGEAQSLVDQGQNVGYIALEESLQRTALRLMSVKANKPLHLNNELPQNDLKAAFDESLGTGQVFLRDGFGSVDPEAILRDLPVHWTAKPSFNGLSWIAFSILMSGGESSR